VKTYQLYGGAVTLGFDEGKHIYTVDGITRPSVTGIIKVIDKSGPLMGWVAKLCSEEVAAGLKAGSPLDELEIKDLCERVKKAYRRASEKAGDIGTMAHEWFEAFGKHQLGMGYKPHYPVNPRLRNCVDAFLGWVKEDEVRFVECEPKIYSRLYGYAGTMDLDAFVKDKRGTWDYKSSSAIYPEMRLQLAAYKQAREEEGFGPYEERGIVRVGKDGEGFEAKPFNDHDHDWQGFLSALYLHAWLNKKAA
jgi:hypothetical protein